MARRWLLYSYDAMGLGHVRRSLAVAKAVLRESKDIGALLLTCSPLVDALPIPQGLDYIKLPSARKLDNDHYAPRTLPMEPGTFRRMRARLILDAAQMYDPHLVLIDKSPLGLMGECRDALDALRMGNPGRSMVLGWRDILDDPKTVFAEWSRNGTLRNVETYYNELWVYGDPELFDVREEYNLPGPIASRIRYLGYLAPDVDAASRELLRSSLLGNEDALAVVTPGGGEDGERVTAAYLDAASRGLLPRRLRSLVVTGPAMPASALAGFQARSIPGVTVETFRADLTTAIAAADVVVGMGGYNTVCEALAGRTPAVLAPRRWPRQEQYLRAKRFEARGLCRVVEPEPRALSDGVRQALASGPLRGRLPACGGLERVRQEVRRILQQAGGANGAPARMPLSPRLSSPRGEAWA